MEAVYPHSQVQWCIVHQICSSTRFVSYKDIKPLMADLKKVYTAVTEDEALEHLMAFKEKWGKQYSSCVKSWKDNWDILSTFFAYPIEIRKIIYTTNIIEGLNRRLPKSGFMLLFPGRETAFTLHAHTVSRPGTRVGKPG